MKIDKNRAEYIRSLKEDPSAFEILQLFQEMIEEQQAAAKSAQASLRLQDLCIAVDHAKKQFETKNNIQKLVSDAIAAGEYMIGDLSKKDALLVESELISRGFSVKIETEVDNRGNFVDSENLKMVLFTRDKKVDSVFLAAPEMFQIISQLACIPFDGNVVDREQFGRVQLDACNLILKILGGEK